MKKRNLRILEILGGILFALSSSVLSFELIPIKYYSIINMLFTCFVSFICAAIYYKNTYRDSIQITKKNLLFTLFVVIGSIVILRKFYFTKALVVQDSFQKYGFNPFELQYFILSFFSIVYLVQRVLYKIKTWLLDFYKSLNSWEKKAYAVATASSIFLIVLAYTTNYQWFFQYDKVYSIDSGDVFGNFVHSSVYWSVRHPLYGLYSFPLYAIINVIAKNIATGQLYTVIMAILLQIINSQFLILVGLLIEKLAKKKIVFILYMLSFPTLLFTLFLEKYQVCVFLLVLYFYTLCTNKEKSKIPLIAAAGTILTSAIASVCEFFVDDSLKNKIKKLFSILILAILAFICFGRAHVFVYGLSEIHEITTKFTATNFSLLQNIILTTKMIQHCFIALPSTVTNHIYLWTSLYEKFSFISILLIGVMVVGMIHKRKDLFTKINTFWFLFAFFLFVVIKWSSGEAPLFSIYFSWAMIPLFVEGCDFLIHKLKWNAKWIYGLFTFFMVMVNWITILDIWRYLSLL